jgi:hypothetical protein
MTLREDLIITVGFVILLMLARFDRENVITIRRAGFLAILLAFVVASHMIVSAVVLGTLFLYGVYCIIRKRMNIVKGLIITVLIAGVLSSPFIFVQYFGIVAQLMHGIEFIQGQGFDITYTWIKASHFNLPIDILVIASGALFLGLSVSKAQTHLSKSKVILLYFTTIAIGIAISYIPHLGLKQDRFLIYAYVLFPFLLFYLLTGLYSRRFGKIIIPILVLVLFTTAVSSAIEYQGYFPINEKNLTYIEYRLSELDSYGKIYVGGTAGTILAYLNSRSALISFKDNFQHIPDELDGPVVMTSDDIAAYRARQPYILERFEELKTLNDPEYDNVSRVWIVFPKSTSDQKS